MKLLYPERVLFFTAQTANANYPISNIRDSHPQKYWKATSTSSWVRLHCDIQSAAVAMAGINAIHIDITIKSVITGSSTTATNLKLIDSAALFVTGGIQAGYFVWNHATGATTTVVSVDSETQVTLAADIFSIGNAYSIETGDLVPIVSTDFGGAVTYSELITSSGAVMNRTSLNKSFGYQYGYQTVKHNILINLFSSDMTHCGVMSAGQLMQFNDPEYGLTEGLKDYSIIKDLNNGSPYVKKRFIARTFSGKTILHNDIDFYTFMRDFSRINGSLPAFWWVTDKTDNAEWVVFAMFDSMPGGSHSYPLNSEVNFSITEVF